MMNNLFTVFVFIIRFLLTNNSTIDHIFIQAGDFRLPDKLQKVTVPVVGDTACGDAYKPRYHITDSMICAGVEEGKS